MQRRRFANFRRRPATARLPGNFEAVHGTRCLFRLESSDKLIEKQGHTILELVRRARRAGLLNDVATSRSRARNTHLGRCLSTNKRNWDFRR